MIAVLIIILLVLTFILIKSADIVVIALRRLSHTTHASGFVLSALLLALATSFPELFVSVTSAIQKETELSLGVVIGSNIANISLIAGFAALLAGKVVVHGEFLRKDVGIALFAAILPIIFSIDGSLNRTDGLLLIVVYVVYATSLFKIRFIEIAERHKMQVYFHRLFRKINHIDVNKTKELGKLLIGIAMLLASADLISRVSNQLASYANIPVFLIGLILLAVGTSLPELAFSLRSLEDGEPKMFFGNLLGSLIVNSTLIVGLSVIISPVTNISLNKYLFSAVFFIVIFLTFWFLIRSKFRLERWEAASLILLYVIFAIVEFI